MGITVFAAVVLQSCRCNSITKLVGVRFYQSNEGLLKWALYRYLVHHIDTFCAEGCGGYIVPEWKLMEKWCTLVVKNGMISSTYRHICARVTFSFIDRWRKRDTTSGCVGSNRNTRFPRKTRLPGASHALSRGNA